MSKRGNWTDGPCFYVSIVDGPRFNVVAGPFRTHQSALDTVDRARDIGNDRDPRSVFYGWGTVKMATGHREGSLNQQLGL